jgi:cyclopropane-fatty-acyl-phospholipid synthase
MDTRTQAVSSSLYHPILRRIQAHLADNVKIPFEISLWGGCDYQFGIGEPAVNIVVRDRQGLAALGRLDELGICEAYMSGSLDVIGDMLRFVSLRQTLSDHHPLYSLWRRIAPLLIGRSTSNRQAIASHYDFDSAFYLKFMDSSRCYSQAMFERDDETLTTAQHRKLDFAIESCGLRAGDRVLDVGGGWGSFTEHAGQRGIQVTSLTISRESESFLTDLIRRLQLPAKVLNQDFLKHSSPEPYDAIVILGVMEHLPDYGAVLRQIERLLKPGGRVYLDASAFREKHAKPTFVSRYVFPGDHSYLCLHDFLAATAKTQLELVAVYNDSHNYHLTCKAWAENLEQSRDEIIQRWGEALYRRFQLYLWGSAYAFHHRGMEAYRVVLEKPRVV